MVLEDELSSLTRELCMFPTRAFEFKNAGTVVIEQDVADVGSIVWDAEVLMAHYLDLAYGPRLLRGRRVVELGAGTGLAGIVAARLGASVLLTDQAKLLPTLIKNARSNAAELELRRYPSSQAPLSAETCISQPPFSSTETRCTSKPPSSETHLPQPLPSCMETRFPSTSPSCMETRTTRPPHCEEANRTSSPPSFVETLLPQLKPSSPSWSIGGTLEDESSKKIEALVTDPPLETEESALDPSAGSDCDVTEQTSIRRRQNACSHSNHDGTNEKECLRCSKGLGDGGGVDGNSRKEAGFDDGAGAGGGGPRGIGDGAGGEKDRGGGGTWRVAELLFSSRLEEKEEEEEEEVFRSVSVAAGSKGLFDLVLAADVIYLRDLWDDMAVTIKALLKPSGEALMTFEQRRSNVENFFGPPRFGGGDVSCDYHQSVSLSNDKKGYHDKQQQFQQQQQEQQLDCCVCWDRRWREVNLGGALEVASRASRIRLFRMACRSTVGLHELMIPSPP